MLIGIDIGTSAAKGVAVSPGGGIAASASSAYEVSRPKPGWSEQDPARWWRATVEVVRALLAEPAVDAAEINGLGFSGQMHGSVFLDAAALADAGGAPINAVRPALLWNDQRTADQCDEIESAAGGRRRLVEMVGNAALTGFTLPKILWLRAHEPANFDQTARVVNPKDFVVLALTGELSADVGDGSGMLLIDPRTRSWSGELLGAVGLDAGLLAEPRESGAVVGSVTRWAAERTGLRPGTPVVAGSGDNQCGAVGAGVVRPGMVLATLGTSGVIYAHADGPRIDLPPQTGPGGAATPAGRVHTLCAATGTADRPGGWCNTGVTLSAAGALHWARDTIAPGVSFETLTGEAEMVPPGSEGLLFMPQLSGERCPYPDPRARGAWIGLNARHGRGHLIRAVLEGVALTMARTLAIVRGLPVEAGEVRLGGGGNKSALWRQIQADCYGLPVRTLDAEEGPSFGAALIAGAGVGAWTSAAEACEATVSVVETVEPSADRAAYERLEPLHDGLYSSLANAMHELDALAAGGGDRDGGTNR